MPQGDRGDHPHPIFRFSIPLVVKFLWSMLLGRTRNLADDVGEALWRVRPSPRILDDHWVPAEGPFVVVANHYDRPGLRVLWGGTLVSHAILRRRRAQGTVHWLMTSEWYNYRLGPLPVPVFVLRWLFRRIARTYDLVIVPRGRERAVGRAAAMRTILEVVRRRGEPIGLFPEGMGSGELIEPQPGTALFLLSLSGHGVPILPAGLYEEEGALTIRFGPPFFVRLPPEAAREDRDRLARQQVMVAIGRLLPRELWGHYAQAVAEALNTGQGEGNHAHRPNL